MSLNSINTNNNAAIALQSLNATSTALQATEKRISTGYRVADATDDGAAYAIAQQVRSDVGALTTANQQLGSAKGLISTTISSLNDVSNKLGNEVRQTLVNLSSNTLDATTRAGYITQFKNQLAEVKSSLQGANYAGKTLVGDISGSKGTFGAIGVAQDEFGSNYSVASTSGSALFNALSGLTASLNTSTGAHNAISQTGTFTTQATNVTSALAVYGAASNHIDSQTTYNNNKIDSLNSGLGALVDADLTKESAKLQALQVRQQLASQSLSIANQAPQSLLSLFK